MGAYGEYSARVYRINSAMDSATRLMADTAPCLAYRARTERDPLGEVSVPADAYYGVQTARAVENFPISGLRAPPISSPPPS